MAGRGGMEVTAERLCIIEKMPWWFIAPLSVLIIIGVIYHERKMKPKHSRSIVVPVLGSAIIICMLLFGYITTEHKTAGQMYSSVFRDFIPVPEKGMADAEKSRAEKIAEKLEAEGFTVKNLPAEKIHEQLTERYPDITMYQTDIIVKALNDSHR